MKNKLLFSFLFFGLFCSTFLNAQCLSSWGYVMPITITNSNASILTNFQVKLNVNTATLIGAGQMLANGDDIRFTDGACTNIDYWIESGINTATTYIWVKVPTIPASGNVTIYMYYGNPAATAAQNGNNVFLFFDDFSGTSVDPMKWTTVGSPSTQTESGGTLSFVGNFNWEYMRSNTTWNGPVVIESRENSVGPSAALIIGYAGTDNRFTFRLNSTLKGTTFDPDVSGGNAWFDMNYPGVPQQSSGYDNYSINADLIANTITLTSYCDNTASACNTTTESLNSATGTGYYIGYSSYGPGYTLNSDWIFVHSFATQVPTSVNGSPQLNVNITSSLSITTFCAGDNLNVDFNAGGSYISGNVFTAELSDATGSFAAPVAIGTLNSSTSGAQTMSATIPSNTTSGTGYRVRVTSSSPVLTGTDNGVDVTINALPTVVANSTASSVCNGSSVTLSGSGASMYSWTGGVNDGISFVPSSTQTYTVTGTDVNGCSNTASTTVSVNTVPNVSLSGADNFCTGGSTTLTGTSGGTSQWYMNGVAIPGETNTTYVATTAGVYNMIKTNLSGCYDSAAVGITVVVNPLPTVVANSTASAVCAGSNVTLSGSGASSYTWTGGVMDAVQFVPATTDTYTVTGTDANGCVNTDVITVNVNALPVVALGSDITQCGGTVMFDAGNAGSTFLWSDASTSQTITVSNAGTYFVDVTDGNGCVGSDTVVANINALPVVDLGTDIVQCGGPVMLDAMNQGSNYLWSDNSTSETLSVSTSGTYYVDVTDGNGCFGSDTINITIHALPTVTGTASSTSVCLSDAAVTLTGTPAGGTWSGPGVTASSFSPSTAGVGAQTTVYSYTDSNGCSAADSVTITVNACTGINEQALLDGVNIYPNPNNGEFVLDLSGNESADVIIYDAIGKQVQALKVMPGVPANIKIDVAGIYYLDIVNASGKHQSVKVIVSQ